MFLTFSVSEISRFLLGPLGGHFGRFWRSSGSLLGAVWTPFGSFRPLMVCCGDPWLPLRSLWASDGLILEPLHSLHAPFGQLQVRVRVLLVILGSFLVHLRSKLRVLCMLCRYWQDFFAICFRMVFIVSLPANWRFPSLAVQVTESALGRFRSLGEAPVGGVLGGNWSL